MDLREKESYTIETMINEFVAKKLGEVLAFTMVATDTLARGRAALVEVLGEGAVVDMEHKTKLHADTIVHIATGAGVAETTTAKAGKTSAKVTQMRDLYIGDQWNNPIEILEWSGFFEGAVIVHWNLVKGAAQALSHAELLALCDECISWHYSLLEQIEGELEDEGSDKATA